MCKPKQLTRNSKDLAIEVSAEPEDLPIDGNASAIDEETDKEIARDIREQLDSGNAWAWCMAHVRVTYRGVLSSDSYLGGCSYASEKDFRNDNGYYGQMVDECIAELNKRLVLLCGPGKDDTAS